MSIGARRPAAKEGTRLRFLRKTLRASLLSKPLGAVMKRSDIYHTHPGILGGTPVFVGTRVPVDSLIQHLQGGTTLGEFLDDFPSVRREQAVAFLDRALHDALDHVPHAANAPRGAQTA